MTLAHIRPRPAFGSVGAPPSKSYTHRALVVAHLSHRRFEVRRPLDSDDTRATSTAIRRLGSTVERRPDVWTVHPAAARRASSPVVLPCGESGTTLRFGAALAARATRPVILSGAGRLGARPVDELLVALGRLGASCRHLRTSGLPIRVRGPIHGGAVTLDASQSSQFTSALLLVLPTLEEDSTIRLTGDAVSQPYVEATLAVLAHHGVRVDRTRSGFRVPGDQTFRGSRFTVPGDASSAAYLWSAAAVSGGEVEIHHLSLRWPQADLAVLDLLDANGAVVTQRAEGAVVRSGRRRPFRVDLTDAPDLYPLAGVLAATTAGVSRIVGAPHVALKESDRKAETAALARDLGAKVTETREGLRVEGTARVRRLVRTDLRDHRMVMSAAVGALVADGPSVLGDASVVRKSFPGFWNVFRSLTGGGAS
ncbi:MAG TPA: 3-phosphoshikimate 1-carboxyvinyltransferase [Thermoplasmata archaeon]|nr:3-phosphoshikimate 1-carboxyvinyltransferase [Thermoplasmata archaeon]